VSHCAATKELRHEEVEEIVRTPPRKARTFARASEGVAERELRPRLAVGIGRDAAVERFSSGVNGLDPQSIATARSLSTIRPDRYDCSDDQKRHRRRAGVLVSITNAFIDIGSHDNQPDPR
jgi:hypothetical protein